MVVMMIFQSDAYRSTGCYNLLCSGFVQTNRRIAIGAAISPRSSYRGGQFDISLLIWKVTLDTPPYSLIKILPYSMAFSL